MNRKVILSSVIAALLAGCSGQGNQQQALQQEENREAKAQMQGVWVDYDTEDVSFRILGDTIFYADSTSIPAYFKVVGDSLFLGSGTSYGIDRQTENLFWFRNQNGDLIKLKKSEQPEEDILSMPAPPKIMTYTHQVKTDSVVMYGGERYHWYIAINPTKYRVLHSTYNDDGMEVQNVYYDNIMHISLFKGAQRLYSSDFRKQQYSHLIPEKFLEEAILSDMEYSKADAAGLHFCATVCIPDGASCYLVETVISYRGEVTMRLLE